MIKFFTLFLTVALADTPKPDTSEEEDTSQEESEKAPDAPSSSEVEASGEIIIYGERELARTRSALDSQIRAQGYGTVKKSEGKTVYRPDIAWKPSVIIYDEGYMLLRRTPVRFEPWIQGKKDNKLRYLSCIPPFTVLCIRSGWLVNGRKLAHSKEEMVEVSLPAFETWQAQVIAQATENRIQNEVPALLDALWIEGRSITSREIVLDSHEMRKKELLLFWKSRACTPEGDRVRQTIEAYIAFEVQASEYAFIEPAQLEQEACGLKLNERLTALVE